MYLLYTKWQQVHDNNLISKQASFVDRTTSFLPYKPSLLREIHTFKGHGLTARPSAGGCTLPVRISFHMEPSSVSCEPGAGVEDYHVSDT